MGSLAAQAIAGGDRARFRHFPQLQRFKPKPAAYIAEYFGRTSYKY
jgi:hypothetical protein